MRKPVRIDFVLHERAGNGLIPIDEVNFGSLLARLGDRKYSHMLRVEYRRAQEIELVVGLVVAGAGMFAASYLKTLGEEFAKWTVEELKRRRKLGHARIEAGRSRVVVSRSRDKRAAVATASLFAAAAKRKGTIEIVFEERGMSASSRGAA